MIGPRWVYAALAAFVLGAALWWPRVLVIGDEERYVTQAIAYAQGRLTIEGAGIIHPAEPIAVMNDYPPGTSLLQAPFVAIAGWRGAVALSVLSMVLATLLCMRWLRDRDLAPGFALLVPGFFGAAFFGRVAMSDVPSAAIVALAALALWRADRGPRAGWSFVAGFAAGASLLFREPNVVLLAPLFAHALFTGRGSRGAIVAGGAAGVALRLAFSQWFYGSPWYVRDSGYGFSLASLGHTIPPYAIALLLMAPLAAAIPFFYRGERRRAMQASVILYVAMFLLYDYDSIAENGPVKGTILASRYVVPALPLLAFMAADVFPGWYRALAARGRRLERLTAGLTRLIAAVMIAGTFLVHPLASRQEAVPSAIAGDMQSHTRPDEPVVTNNKATLKYLSAAYGPRRLILRAAADSATLRRYLEAQPSLAVALLDRTDSEMFREDAQENERFLQRVSRHCELMPRHQGTYGGWARLRILELRDCK